jgi:hypothetical protein
LLEPGDVRRHRLRDASSLERGQVLHPDQQGVVERPGPESGRELHRLPPVIAGYQAIDRADHLIV